MGVRIRKHRGEYYIYINHKRFRQAQRIGKDRRQAEQTRLSLIRKIASGEFQFKNAPQAIDPENDVTLREYFETFKDTHLRNSVRPSTAESYVGNFKLHILPVLGDLRLSQITPKRISEFIVGLMTKRGKGNNHRKDKPLSKSTIRLQIAYLRKVLNKALKEGRIASNPASRVGEEYKQAANLHEDINPLTESEIESYLKAARKEDPQYYYFFALALQAGLRAGESAALNWEEVNLDKKRIHIRRTLTKDGKLGPPKSKKSVRFVKLTDSLAQELHKWKKEQKDKYGNVPYVLCSLSGKARININHCRKVHSDILKELGIRKIRLHDLRHTYATFLLQKGASVAWVSRQMGHSSIQVTVDTYFHYLPDEDDRDAAFLNEFPSASNQDYTQ